MNPPPARINDILKAFQAVIVVPRGTVAGAPSGSGISKANGFTYDLTEEHVYLPAQQDILNSDEVAVFPKIVFAIDGGQLNTGASRRVSRTIRLSVMVIIKEANLDIPLLADKPQGWRPVGDQARDIKDDIETAILRNTTLGELVDKITPTDFETDSNFSYPNAIIVVWADVEYMNN